MWCFSTQPPAGARAGSSYGCSCPLNLKQFEWGSHSPALSQAPVAMVAMSRGRWPRVSCWQGLPEEIPANTSCSSVAASLAVRGQIHGDGTTQHPTQELPPSVAGHAMQTQTLRGFCFYWMKYLLHGPEQVKISPLCGQENLFPIQWQLKMEILFKVTKSRTWNGFCSSNVGSNTDQAKPGSWREGGEIKEWEDRSGLFNKKPEIDLSSPSSSLCCFRAQTKKGTLRQILECLWGPAGI